jgi:hypothetical protein
MKRTNYYFEENMLSELRGASKKTGLPVVAIIRIAIMEWLKCNK